MFAVAGGKGGVGKTTVAAGLAAAFARQGRRPIAVDADADMPNLHTVLDAPAEPAMEAVTAGTPAADAAVRSGRFAGVDVLPALPGDDPGAALDVVHTSRPVVVDCPGGVGPDAAAPLRRASRVVVVSDATDRAASAARKTAAAARSIGAEVAGGVVTRTDDPPGDLADVIGAPILATLPNRGPRPLESDAVRAELDGAAAALTESLSGYGQ